MDRLTKKYAGGYGLVKVKDNEQDLESPYPNTLRACFESWQRLGAYEDTGLTPEEVEALKSERDRFKARAEAAEMDFRNYVHHGGENCAFCKHDDECEPGESLCYANKIGWDWRGPQEGANQ